MKALSLTIPKLWPMLKFLQTNRQTDKRTGQKQEKFLITSIFSLSHNALTHSHTMTPFDAPGKQTFENTAGKGEIARNEQFLLFPQCLLPIWITFCHFG